MEVTGTVKEFLDEQTGEGRNGEWRKGGFVIETGDRYPDDIAIDIWNDTLDEVTDLGIDKGDVVTVSINIKSREYQGKWYTNVSGYKVEPEKKSEFKSEKENTKKKESEPLPADDDLPF